MPDVNVSFSQNASVDAKMAISGLTDKLKSGVSGIADAVKGAAGSVSQKLQSAFKTPDFPVKPPTKNKQASKPEEKIQAAKKPIGVYEYPAKIKYFTKFSFYKYSRAHALDAPKDQPVAQISFPLPANLAENFGVEYQTPALGPVVGAVVDSTTNSMKNMVTNLTGFGGMKGLKEATQKVGEAGAASLMYNAKSMGAAAETAAQVASTQLGASPNPHLAVLFSNIGLREHSFSYKFAPNSQEELNVIKKIVKQLKQSMLPGLSTSGTLFLYPHTCQIKFMASDKTEILYPIKQCVMKSMTVNYTPNGTPAFFKTGDPVMVELSMTFMEMSPFTSEDVDKTPPTKIVEGRPRGGA